MNHNYKLIVISLLPQGTFVQCVGNVIQIMTMILRYVCMYVCMYVSCIMYVSHMMYNVVVMLTEHTLRLCNYLITWVTPIRRQWLSIVGCRKSAYDHIALA